MDFGDKPAFSGGLGVFVTGCGSIRRLRADILRAHPAMRSLTVCDTHEAKGAVLASFATGTKSRGVMRVPCAIDESVRTRGVISLSEPGGLPA